MKNSKQSLNRFLVAFAVALALSASATARAHYIWLTVEPAESPGGSVLRAFFNEQPLLDPGFTKYVRDVQIRVEGQAVPSTLGEESRVAPWVGKAPLMVDAERDLGVMTKGGKSFRLFYTARAQTEPVAGTTQETADKLRVRLIQAEGPARVAVLFDGKPVARARVRVYPEVGEPTELATDDQGMATVAGLSQGEAALWANWVDSTPGEVRGDAFAETRYYATFTYAPSTPSTAIPTAFATLQEPAVNSFGGAVLGDWLYVYSGHVGSTHKYSVETTAKHFRRLNLKDRTTWEDLPMGPDLQGVALVSDGRFLYRIGGMAARNLDGEEHDLRSVADFARFDPEARIWTDLAPMPEPRSTHDAVVIGRKVYVVGGWTMERASEDSGFPETALEFDLDHPESGWKAFPQPFRRRALSVGEQGGKLFAMGGLVGGGMKVDLRVDAYDPRSGRWSRGPDLPQGGRTEGFGTSAFQVAGRLYYSGASGRISRLTEKADAWEAVGAWSLPRITHRVLPGPEGTLLAVGGNANGKQTPVIEAVRLPSEGCPLPPAGSD